MRYKKKWIGLGLVVVGVATGLVIAACSNGDQGNAGTSSAAVEFTGSTVGSATDGGALGPQNVSAVWSPQLLSRSGGMFCVGSSMTQNSSDPSDMMAWFFAQDATSNPYTHCSPSTAGCADCAQTTQFPTIGFTTLTGSDLLGSPSLAADNQGNVVYVGLASTTGSSTTADTVVAMISTDGGQTFNNMVVVNSDSGHSCNTGTQRLPHATFDTTVFPPVLYVVWGNNNSGQFGGCMRHGTIDITNTQAIAGCPTSPIIMPVIDWITNSDGDSSESISNMKQSCNWDGCQVGQGGLMVQAGDGNVTVMYSGNDAVGECVDGGSGNFTQMGWGTVTTFDEGVSWSTDPWIVLSDNYPRCIGPAGPTPMIPTGFRDFGFTRAGNGHLYAAVHDTTDSIRVFDSDDKGRHWREFCIGNIGNQPDGGAGSTGVNVQSTPWVATGISNNTGSGPSGFSCLNQVADGGLFANASNSNADALWPTLASDGDTSSFVTFSAGTTIAQQKSRVVLSWSQANVVVDAGTLFPSFMQEFQANSDPASPGPNTDRFQTATSMALNPQTMGPSFSAPPIAMGNLYGSYTGVAVQYSTTSCSEDAGLGLNNPNIFCHEATFWPYWIETPITAPPNTTSSLIRTRAVQVTN